MQSLHSLSKLSHHGLVVSLCSLPSFLRPFIVCKLSMLRGNCLLLTFAPWLMTLFFSNFYGGDSGETFF